MIGASQTWNSQKTWQSAAVGRRDDDVLQNRRSIFFKPSIAVLTHLSVVEAHVGQFLTSCQAEKLQIK